MDLVRCMSVVGKILFIVIVRSFVLVLIEDIVEVFWRIVYWDLGRILKRIFHLFLFLVHELTWYHNFHL